MKFIPYLRICWALVIVANFFLKPPAADGADSVGMLAQGLMILVVGTFVLYCVLMGIQEITNNQFIQARFFNIFGLVFEVIAFFSILYILKISGGEGFEVWEIALLAIWQIGLLALIVVDIRKFWMA